jgi:Uma2 family endonuclease
MATAFAAPAAEPLTYEAYLAEGEIMARYDIIDGVRHWMTSPNELHQEIALNIAEHFRAYQRAARRGRTVIAPRDIVVQRQPLRTRQPDVYFISNERRAEAGTDVTDPAPLAVAPELVVEVLSRSDTRRVLADKLADYCAVGVCECWVVSPEAETVEALRLTSDGAERVGLYGVGDTVRSVTFDDLAVALADIFDTED